MGFDYQFLKWGCPDFHAIMLFEPGSSAFLPILSKDCPKAERIPSYPTAPKMAAYKVLE